MQPPQVNNRTELLVHPHMHLGRGGEELLVLVKGTFLLRTRESELELAPPNLAREIRFADVPWGMPESTPPMYPCDAVGFKPGTDVIVVAAGHAPGGAPTPSFDVRVRVGPVDKSLRVFGLRVWQDNGSGVSAPRPASSQEIRYDAAWGGLDATDPARIREEPRNPMGSGVTNSPGSLTHKPAPAIEDPSSPVRAANGSVIPGGFGPIGPGWEPRRSHMGTYDARWHAEKAPLAPDDFDDRANLCASPGMTAQPPLSGGETIELHNLTPGGGIVALAVPRLTVSIALAIDGREGSPRFPHLDTLIIDTLKPPPQHLVALELVWRAVMPMPRQPKRARIVVSEPEPDGEGR